MSAMVANVSIILVTVDAKLLQSFLLTMLALIWQPAFLLHKYTLSILEFHRFAFNILIAFEK